MGSETGPSPNRARDHLANERTFLAWIRTALALIGLGFVLARAGLLLDRVASASGVPEPIARARDEFVAAGLGSLIAGVALTGWSYRLYGRNGRAIEADNYRPARESAFALTAVVVAAGSAIAIIVVVRAAGQGLR